MKKAGRMNVLRSALVVLSLLLFTATATAAAAEPEPARSDAKLIMMNREIVILRADLAGASPALRVERAQQRYRALDEAALKQPIRAVPFALDEARGYQLLLGDHLLFSLLEADRDPESNQPFDALLRQTETRLEELRRAKLEQNQTPALLRAVWHSLLATIVLLAALWGLTRGSRALIARFERARDRSAAPHLNKVPWDEYAFGLLVRLSHIVWLLVGALFLYLWLTYLLRNFPLTRPLGDRLGNFIVSTAGWIGSGLVGAVPGFITVILVLSITRAIVSVLNVFFRNVQSGRVQVPFLHAETTSATRRIFTIVTWGLGIAVAYPFIPGSSSDAFKGLSVLFGLVISLGSTGLVTQMMSGLVVVYTRALRKNDYVSVAGIEGLISEIGALATKVVTVRNEVVTVPNSVLIGSPIHNFSRMGDERRASLSVRVSIGYDTPWQQVRALLLEAAARTRGLRADAAPFVYQRALGDFSVEYELYTPIEQPRERNRVLSALIGNVLDVFNENGVQIMSPHFQVQPEQNIVARPWSGLLAGSAPASRDTPG